MVVFAVSILGLALCESGSPTKDENPWVVIQLDKNVGHDTIEDGERGIYHNYYFAIVFERSDESLQLIYQNGIPDNVDLELNGQYHIDLGNAGFDNAWDGYWLHNVVIRDGSIE